MLVHYHILVHNFASPIPAFDVFTSTPGYPIPLPAPSDSESNFLQARVPIDGDAATDVTTPFAEPLATACTNGEIIELRVYVHNVLTLSLMITELAQVWLTTLT